MDRVLAPFAYLLPSAEASGVRRSRVASALAALLLLALGAHIAYAVVGAGTSETADVVIDTVARQLTMVCAALLCALSVSRDDPDRGAWLALAVGLGLWVAGSSYWNAFLAASARTRRAAWCRRTSSSRSPSRPA